MDKSTFDQFFKSGDSGSLWAAIENAVSQRDSSLTGIDDLKAQLAAAQKSATEAAAVAEKDKVDAVDKVAAAARDDLGNLGKKHDAELADMQKRLDDQGAALVNIGKERDAALAAQKTADTALAALRAGQAALAKAAQEAHEAGDTIALTNIIAEAGKDEAQRQQDAKDKRKAELKAELDAL